MPILVFKKKNCSVVSIREYLPLHRTRSLRACFQGFFRCLVLKYRQSTRPASSGVILGALKRKHSSLQMIFILLTLFAGRAAARATGFFLGLPTAIRHWEFSTGGCVLGGGPGLALGGLLCGGPWKEQGAAGAQAPHPFSLGAGGPARLRGLGAESPRRSKPPRGS